MARRQIIHHDPRPRLAEAIANSKELTILYMGGSQRGRKRLILPIRMFRDCIFAIFQKYGWEQKFRIDKVQIVDPDYHAPEYLPLQDRDEETDEEGEEREAKKRPSKRSQVLSVRFVDGYAENWAFRVHEVFRPALDIKLTTVMDGARTYELRLQRLQEFGYSSWEDLKDRVIDPDERKRIKSEIYRYKRFRQVWTEGIPLEGESISYDFHEGDTLHSNDGFYTVQVNSVAPDGMRGIQVFRKGDDDRLHHCKDIFCTQKEFVAILQYGLGRYITDEDNSILSSAA
jgi:hypothetical protein